MRVPGSTDLKWGRLCRKNVPDMGIDSVKSSGFWVSFDGIGTYFLMRHPVLGGFLMGFGLSSLWVIRFLGIS